MRLSLLSNTSSMLACPTGLRPEEPLKMTSVSVLAAQMLGGTLAHHPAHGVDDVGLAAAVGADDRAQIAGEIDGGGVHERLEPGQFDPACNARRLPGILPCRSGRADY
jgi:hypothetical protein